MTSSTSSDDHDHIDAPPSALPDRVGIGRLMALHVALWLVGVGAVVMFAPNWRILMDEGVVAVAGWSVLQVVALVVVGRSRSLRVWCLAPVIPAVGVVLGVLGGLDGVEQAAVAAGRSSGFELPAFLGRGLALAGNSLHGGLFVGGLGLLALVANTALTTRGEAPGGGSSSRGSLAAGFVMIVVATGGVLVTVSGGLGEAEGARGLFALALMAVVVVWLVARATRGSGGAGGAVAAGGPGAAGQQTPLARTRALVAILGGALGVAMISLALAGTHESSLLEVLASMGGGMRSAAMSGARSAVVGYLAAMYATPCFAAAVVVTGLLALRSEGVTPGMAARGQPLLLGTLGVLAAGAALGHSRYVAKRTEAMEAARSRLTATSHPAVQLPAGQGVFPTNDRAPSVALVGDAPELQLEFRAGAEAEWCGRDEPRKIAARVNEYLVRAQPDAPAQLLADRARAERRACRRGRASERGAHRDRARGPAGGGGRIG